MKNSPSAVAGGLFFCVRRDGEFRAPAASALFVSDGDSFAPPARAFLLSPTASFLSAAKEKRKRNAAKNYVFGFPYAASRGFYPAKISHANIVPRKFHLNIALSLLLGALPLLL